MKDAPASSSSGPSREEGGEQEEGWISRYMGTLLWVDGSWWEGEGAARVCGFEGRHRRTAKIAIDAIKPFTAHPPLLLVTTTDSLPSLTGSMRPGG